MRAMQTELLFFHRRKAGFESTSVALTTFILVMLLHPDIQKKAKEELDSVVGHDRFPEFSDKPDLPYLSAVLKEVLRYSLLFNIHETNFDSLSSWNPIVGLGKPVPSHFFTLEFTGDSIGVPHCTDEEDEYRGYRIPKNSIIVANT
jgi:hypothetical protein